MPVARDSRDLHPTGLVPLHPPWFLQSFIRSNAGLERLFWRATAALESGASIPRNRQLHGRVSRARAGTGCRDFVLYFGIAESVAIRHADNRGNVLAIPRSRALDRRKFSGSAGILARTSTDPPFRIGKGAATTAAEREVRALTRSSAAGCAAGFAFEHRDLLDDDSRKHCRRRGAIDRERDFAAAF